MKRHEPNRACRLLIASRRARSTLPRRRPDRDARRSTAVAGARPTFPFELFRGNRIILNGSVNGIDTPMMLDSGAGVTTLDRDFAQKIGLKTGQKITRPGRGRQRRMPSSSRTSPSRSAI